MPINSQDLALRIKSARETARQAGAFTREKFILRDTSSVSFKGAHDYLTTTDQEVERIAIEKLSGLFPDDTFLGEESGGTPTNQVWVIDPIDGTENFVRGIPHFCISIAYVRDGEVLLGVIYNPMSEEMFTAVKGQGTAVNDRPMQISQVTELGRALIELGSSPSLPLTQHTALVTRITDSGAAARRAGSAALGMAYVADGRVEGYCEMYTHSWDVLAGVLMVQEAGGWCSDFLANDGLTGGNSILAVAPGIKREMIGISGIGK